MAMDIVIGIAVVGAGLFFLLRTDDVVRFYRGRLKWEWQQRSLPFVIRFVGAAWIVFGLLTLIR